MDLLVERVANNQRIENFMKDTHKGSITEKDIERYDKFNRDVNEYLRKNSKENYFDL